MRCAPFRGRSRGRAGEGEGDGDRADPRGGDRSPLPATLHPRGSDRPDAAGEDHRAGCPAGPDVERTPDPGRPPGGARMHRSGRRCPGRAGSVRKTRSGGMRGRRCQPEKTIAVRPDSRRPAVPVPRARRSGRAGPLGVRVASRRARRRRFHRAGALRPARWRPSMPGVPPAPAGKPPAPAPR